MAVVDSLSDLINADTQGKDDTEKMNQRKEVLEFFILIFKNRSIGFKKCN